MKPNSLLMIEHLRIWEVKRCFCKSIQTNWGIKHFMLVSELEPRRRYQDSHLVSQHVKLYPALLQNWMQTWLLFDCKEEMVKSDSGWFIQKLYHHHLVLVLQVVFHHSSLSNIWTPGLRYHLYDLLTHHHLHLQGCVAVFWSHPLPPSRLYRGSEREK